MNDAIASLDEYFCAHYADYERLAALEGYVMPEMLVLGADGSVSRLPSEMLRLSHQKEKDAILAHFKEDRVDTDFTFSFRFPTFGERMAHIFRRRSFSRLLPDALSRCGETAESAGEKLTIAPKFWKKIVRGSLIPEKGTVFALALVCHMGRQDAENLLTVCGYGFDGRSVRDVVVRYMLEQRVFAPELRNACLLEYKIDTLPIAM